MGVELEISWKLHDRQEPDENVNNVNTGKSSSQKLKKKLLRFL